MVGTYDMSVIIASTRDRTVSERDKNSCSNGTYVLVGETRKILSIYLSRLGSSKWHEN